MNARDPGAHRHYALPPTCCETCRHRGHRETTSTATGRGRQLCIASPKHPIVRGIITQPLHEFFGLYRRQRPDVFPQLMHIPDLAEEL
jgi:hypothetical protein